MYLDNAATTPLTKKVKKYIIELLDIFQNPSSQYQDGINVKKIIEQSRLNVSKFINTEINNIYFTSSGSASNTLAIKGITSDNPLINEYEVFYSPTAHKSMLKACESCLCNTPLKVNKYGEIDLLYLSDILTKHNKYKPLVCVEAGNSEIGTINDIVTISNIVHSYKGILVVDVTGYIPSIQVDMNLWDKVDIITFSAHKLGALKGCGVLYKKPHINLKPLVYGTQEQGIIGGTENVLGIASLGKSVENYNYTSISSESRDYIYKYIINNIPNTYLIGSPINENRLPHNLYMCFKGISGEALMTLLDMNNIQVSTGSACNNNSLRSSTTLNAIKMNKDDIHSCIRLSFTGVETKEELDYVCKKINECVNQLRCLAQ